MQRHPFAAVIDYAGNHVRISNGETNSAPGDLGLGVHSDRSGGKRFANRRNWSARTVLGSRQGAGIFSRVLRLAHVRVLVAHPVYVPPVHEGLRASLR